jgi:hypothetical protein
MASNGTIKSSALIGREGVGAIVEEGSLAYVVAPLERWTPHGANLTFSAPARVLDTLGKTELRRFSLSDEGDKRRTDGMIPHAVRFPRAVICMSCDRMYIGSSGNQEQHCGSCKGKGRPSNLFGANWIMVCHRGHIDDIWWAGLAHRDLLGTASGDRVNCKSDMRLYLTTRSKWKRMRNQKQSTSEAQGENAATPVGGLNMYTNQVIGCDECGSASDLNSLRSAGTGVRRCRSADPWGEDDNPKRNGPHCSWPILRSSTQVMQVSGASFLDLENEDEGKPEKVSGGEVLEGWQKDVDDDSMACGYRDQVLRKSEPDERIRLSKRFAESVLKRIAWAGTAPTVEELESWMRGESGMSPVRAIDPLDTSNDTATRFHSEADYLSRMEEWRVLAGASVRRKSLVLDRLKPPSDSGIQSLASVGRFREIRVPLGYTRVHSTRPGGAGHACKSPASCDQLIQPRGVSDSVLPWLPAHEVFGEGLYIELDSAMISSVVSDDRYAASHAEGNVEMESSTVVSRRLDYKMLSAPVFPIVHTFSHLLIKELAFLAGYSLPSLRERVYADTSMARAGVLIYTADGDSEGSLGGLVRLAQGDQIGALVKRLIVRSSWCPQDPICWESERSGVLGLNRSACHGCTLIPETSCAHSNLRLDRHAIVDPTFGMQRWIRVAGGRHG